MALIDPVTLNTAKSATGTGLGAAAGVNATNVELSKTSGAVPAGLVESRVNSIIGQDSPLMQTARFQGNKAANSRGLLNSSVAIGAAQDAMIKNALPIAQQDAEADYQVSEREKDRTAQKQLTSMQLASSDRNAAAQFATNMEQLYQTNVQSIMNNTALSADQRSAYLTSARQLRDNQMDLVQQFYDIQLDWGRYTPPAAAPTAAVAPAQVSTPAESTASGYPVSYGLGDNIESRRWGSR